MTLHEMVLETARQAPERVALIDGPSGAATDYGTLAARIRAVAGTLAGRGFGPGDRLALWAPNCPPWADVALGAMAAGGAVSPVSPAAAPRELASALRTVEPKLLVTITPFAGAAREAAGGIEVLEIGPELYAGGSPPEPAAATGDPALLPFSSGTTGLPKAVVLTHANLAASLEQLQERMLLTERDRLLALAPFAHIMGSVVTLLAPLVHGATAVTMPRFDLDLFFELIERHRVNMLTVPPPLVSLLARHPVVERHDLSSVEGIVCGGAPLAASVQEALARRFPGVMTGQAYGMTETSVLITAPDRTQGALPGTVGRPASGTEIRIVEGELHVRGPHVMAGYFREPERTREVLSEDGWLRTGDLARLRDDGALEIVGRIKELIKVSGYQVAPAELEALMLEFPGVQDAAAIGAPDERRGEAVVAFVVGEVDLDALGAWLAERVSPYKRPRELHAVQSLPRTPAGKLLRHVLADELRAVAV